MFFAGLKWCFFFPHCCLQVVVICSIISHVSIHLNNCLPSFSSALFPFVINMYPLPHQTFSWFIYLVWIHGFLFYSIGYNLSYILMFELSQIWLAVLCTFDMSLSIPPFWNKMFQTCVFYLLSPGITISPRSRGFFYWRRKPSLWAELGNICIPYIYRYWYLYLLTLKSIFIHTSAGFILGFSFSIFLTPFSASSHYNQSLIASTTYPGNLFSPCLDSNTSPLHPPSFFL